MYIYIYISFVTYCVGASHSCQDQADPEAVAEMARICHANASVKAGIRRGEPARSPRGSRVCSLWNTHRWNCWTFVLVCFFKPPNTSVDTLECGATRNLALRLERQSVIGIESLRQHLPRAGSTMFVFARKNCGNVVWMLWPKTALQTMSRSEKLKHTISSVISIPHTLV